MTNNVSVTAAAIGFGLHAPITVKRLRAQTLHRLFKCSDASQTLAIKWLTRRPDLPGWFERFLFAYSVESTLARCHDFLPAPRAADSGPILVTDDGAAWFVAHSWHTGRQAFGLHLSDVAEQLGRVIDETSRVHIERAPPIVQSHDPVPQLAEVLTHCRESLPAEAELHPRLDMATPLLEAILHAERPAPNIIGHRDLSPQNVLLRPDSRISVLDWENAGPTHITQEAGRVLATWPCESSQLRRAVSSLLGTNTPTVHEPQPFWFRDWLEGHLMFTEYLWRAGPPALASYRTQLQSLDRFVSRFREHLIT